MDFTIERIDKTNYGMFEDLTFIRGNGREKTAEELALPREYDEMFKTLANENLYIFAAKVDSANFGVKFVGYVSAVYIPKVGSRKAPGHFFIDELWTQPEYRRFGIAGAIGMRLYTGGDNAAARALYEKCGYKNLGCDACFMEKEWE